MAASTISSSVHDGKLCVAGVPGGLNCGNNQQTAGISIHCIPNNKKDPRRFMLSVQFVQFVHRHRPIQRSNSLGQPSL